MLHLHLNPVDTLVFLPNLLYAYIVVFKQTDACVVFFHTFVCMPPHVCLSSLHIYGLLYVKCYFPRYSALACSNQSYKNAGNAWSDNYAECVKKGFRHAWWTCTPFRFPPTYACLQFANIASHSLFYLEKICPSDIISIFFTHVLCNVYEIRVLSAYQQL